MALALVLLFGCGAPVTPVTKADPAQLRIERAKDYERKRRYDLAELEYRAAIAEAASASSRRQARRQLVDALIFWGKLGEARLELVELLDEHPADVSAWHDLGILHSKLGDAGASERALRRAIELAPKNPKSRIALAALLVNGRRFKEAQAEYRTLLELELPPSLDRAVREALELLARELGKPAT